jgi:hypothetical protein
MAEADANTVPVSNTVIEFELPNLPGKHSFDCATIPADARLQLLKDRVKGYIANRVNAAEQRAKKDPVEAAWAAYEAANDADPLQSVVAKPTAERPVADLSSALDRAFEALAKGEIRQQSKDGPKARERKDPLVAMVTKIVVGEVYNSRHAADPKYTYPMATKEVGTDGIAYLNAMIETKVAAGVDRTALEKMRDERYIKPAQLALGITTNAKTKDLPSIL